MAKNTGKEFEELTKVFFTDLFQKIGFTINKQRLQKSGTQDGFDVLFVISKDYIERKIFIECKDYSNDLSFGNIYAKAHDLEVNYQLSENDTAIFISPRANFGNSKNSEKNEPIFNSGKFPFNIRLLEKNNGVENLFATNKKIYKKIYKQDCLINVDIEKEYEKFQSILFSQGVLRQIQINETDKQKYIINIAKTDHYITRNLIYQQLSSKRENNSTSEYVNELNLFEATQNILYDNDTDGIILLGNPGSGKSIELQNLAINLWEQRNDYKWIPFYRPINTFINSSEIVDYLPKDWKNIPYLLIILDGLDEIAHSIEFKTKLDRFLTENTKTNIKFIISCRTNIYENTIKNIREFDCFVLKEIPYYGAIEFLNKKYQLDSEDFFELYQNSNQQEFLKTPYYLNLFGRYYQQTKKLPTNKVQLIERYIENRLEDDRKIKYKNKEFDKSTIKLVCKKVALAMEAMQVSKISNSHINALLKNEKQQFTNCCFVELVFDEDEWKFEHKNVQEYFVASALKDLEFEQIIQFIKIDDKQNKTHPSWLNSISHLINLFEKEESKFEKLLKWLVENDSEVLFKADRNRVSDELKEIVFQNYFNKRCVQDTLWVRKYDADVKDISRFANCKENVSYLFKVFKNANYHRRTRISALDLISLMDFEFLKNEIKSCLIGLIKQPILNDDFSYAAFLIDSFREFQFHLNNENIVRSIVLFYEQIDHIEITNSIFKLINEVDCNSYLKYIIETAPKTLDNSKRKYQREHNLSTLENRTLKEILKKLSTPKGCLFELEYYLKNKHHFDIKKEDIEESIKKITNLQKVEKVLFSELVKFCLDNEDLLFDFEEIIFSFFYNTSNRKKAFFDIYNSNNEFDKVRRLLTYLVSEKEFSFILQQHKTGVIEIKEIFYFRNNLSHINFELSLKFQDLIIKETGFNFNDELLKIETKNRWKDFHENKLQNEFDILFDKEKLLLLTDEYFDRFDNETLTRDNQLDDRKEYYKSFKLQEKFPQNFIHLIYSSFQSKQKIVTANDVKQKISNVLFLIKNIKSQLQNDKGNKIKIDEVQLNFIKDWCFEEVKNVDFTEYSNYNKRTNHLKCEILLFFRDKFKLKYPKEVVLDFTEVYDETYFNRYKDESMFITVTNEVEKVIVVKRVIENFEKELSSSLVIWNNCLFALENNISSVYHKIESLISNIDISESIRSNVLEKYFEKTNDINLLKKMISFKFENDYEDLLSWTCLKLLIEANEFDFVIKKVLENLSLDLSSKNRIENIKYLMRCNYVNVFKLFNLWLKSNISEFKQEINYGITNKDWGSFTNKNSVNDVIELIQISCDPSLSFNTFSNPIRIAVEVLKNISQNNKPETCLEVINLVEKYKLSIKQKDFDFFYFNDIIENTWDNYLSLKSKPILFKNISQKIDELQYDIL
ncbi:NACHT domain-containing protein [Polaribacter sp. R2A056_3_33]|uniref:NACHT domain-containing protein n=1 Tax=Polaribacter sp. R2A056_3_33 TaxID=2745563 RepID=UPI001C4FED1D|nr:NACHT domain-containing protein [Polaribacter sp. R2A056_3_33]QXP68962.1 NACHT domain-containing protein [Polaribacter sp. R2A056_3_33]